MEKANNWNVGDYIVYKHNVDFRIGEIIGMEQKSGLTYYTIYDFTIDGIYSEYLLFMDKYWENIGNNKEMVEIGRAHV